MRSIVNIKMLTSAALKKKKRVVQSTFKFALDHRDALYSRAAPSLLQQLKPCLSQLCYALSPMTHVVLIFAGWISVLKRRNNHVMIFFYKALLASKLPHTSFKTCYYSTQSNNYLTLDIPYACTNLGRTSFR